MANGSHIKIKDQIIASCPP